MPNDNMGHPALHFARCIYHLLLNKLYFVFQIPLWLHLLHVFIPEPREVSFCPRASFGKALQRRTAGPGAPGHHRGNAGCFGALWRQNQLSARTLNADRSSPSIALPQFFPCYWSFGENGLKRADPELETSKRNKEKNSTARNWLFFWSDVSISAQATDDSESLLKHLRLLVLWSNWCVCAVLYCLSAKQWLPTRLTQHGRGVSRLDFAVRVQGVNNPIFSWLVLKSEGLLLVCFDLFFFLPPLWPDYRF